MLNLAADVLKHVPELIDYDATAKLVADDMTPLNVVLLQEVPIFSVVDLKFLKKWSKKLLAVIFALLRKVQSAVYTNYSLGRC